MCDTFVALPDTTASGEIIFGKNSDRPQGELQDVIALPALEYASKEQVQCTYIKIPQVRRTLAVVLSMPRWMWGAEMGANEQGVVIGNEAVWTNQPYRESGLLGMDLVRLGLERAATASAALDIIVGLLNDYGQGGNCAEHFAMNYHNSYLIADKTEAWVLETAGTFWVAERITSGTRSISNNLSISGKGDRRHSDVIRHAIAKKQIASPSELDFARHFSAIEGQDSITVDSREFRVRQLCQLNHGQFSIETAKSILRDHEGNVCWHGEFETRGSQISSLSPEGCQHWFIDGPFPCQQRYEIARFPASS